MQKKQWTSLAVLAVLAMLFAACAAPVAAPGATGDSSAPAEEAGSITVWSRYDLADTEDANAVTLAQFIEDFETDSGVEVVYEQVAWDQLAPKLSLAVQSGGDVPDVVEAGSQHIPGLLDAGALMPMDDLLADQAWTASLTDGDSKACIVDDARFCVANNVRGGMTYYQADIFPDGMPVEAEAWTEAGETFKADDLYLSSFFAGRNYGAIEIAWWPKIKSNGGSIFDAEGKPAWASEEVAEVAAWAQEMFANGYFPEISVTGDWSDPEIVWTDGQSTSFGGGSWSAIFLDGLQASVDSGDVGMSGGVGFNGGDPYVFMVSEAWVVPTGAANPEGSAAFISAFMEPEFLASWAEAQFGIPTTSDAYALGQFSGSPFYAQVDEILGSQGAYMEQSPYYVESLDILATTWQEMMLDPSLDPLTELQSAADEVLTRYWQ